MPRDRMRPGRRAARSALEVMCAFTCAALEPISSASSSGRRVCPHKLSPPPPQPNQRLSRTSYRLGVLRRLGRRPMPSGRPSLQERSGRWQLEHEMRPDGDSRASKNSWRPRSTAGLSPDTRLDGSRCQAGGHGPCATMAPIWASLKAPRPVVGGSWAAAMAAQALKPPTNHRIATRIMCCKLWYGLRDIAGVALGTGNSMALPRPPVIPEAEPSGRDYPGSATEEVPALRGSRSCAMPAGRDAGGRCAFS